MIRAIVIDDESYMREGIKTRLRDYFPKEVTVVGESDSVKEGVKVVEKFEPELLLLDVHLLDGTGFDLIQNSSYKDFSVIFITGYDTSAIKAIKVGALDFILKPVEDNEFKEAISKAINLQDKAWHLDQLVSVSNDHYRGIARNRVILKTSDGIYNIDLEDVYYCHSEGDYTTVYTKQTENILMSGHLKKMEELLPSDIFIRCHQSYLVNKNHVLKYNKRGQLILKNEMKVPVSSRRKETALLRIFK